MADPYLCVRVNLIRIKVTSKTEVIVRCLAGPVHATGVPVPHSARTTLYPLPVMLSIILILFLHFLIATVASRTVVNIRFSPILCRFPSSQGLNSECYVGTSSLLILSTHFVVSIFSILTFQKHEIRALRVHKNYVHNTFPFISQSSW